MTPRRYQLRKDAVAIIERGHPWIFREQLSSAAHVFRDGDWLRLVDGTNRVIGHGIYETDGAIAIRMLRTGPDRPDAAWLTTMLGEALVRRPAELTMRTTGLRLVHGESDRIPAVVVDQFGDTLVAQSYSRGADALTRYAASWLARELSIPNALLRAARRRADHPDVDARVLRGTPPAVATFVEDEVELAVDLEGGQKSGAYLDLRGLRHAVLFAPLTGARVLNLFSFSGMLGRMAERAGAAHILQVDSSERALAFARAHHVDDPRRHQFVTADIFEWLPTLDAAEQFDLVIVDPPAMTSSMSQVPRVLAAYRKLYKAAASHVRPGGVIVAACCTSRIEPGVFHKTVADSLGGGFARERVIPHERDHPVGFPQAEYLKIGWWRRRAAA